MPLTYFPPNRTSVFLFDLAAREDESESEEEDEDEEEDADEDEDEAGDDA